jgi:PKD repeat protein
MRATPLKLRKALGIYRTEESTDDHKLTVEEIQRMMAVADLKEQIILEVLLLGLRIGDAIILEVSDLDKLEQEAPIELRLRATKEGTIYDTLISQEFKELLQLYLPTIKGKWLFQGIRKGSHAKDETLNLALRNMAKRSGIQLHGRLHWHCGRKLVMRTGVELGARAQTWKSLLELSTETLKPHQRPSFAWEKKMRKLIIGIMLFLIVTSTITVLSNAKTVRADEPTSSEPTVETEDFGNGTRQMITDYGNGTRDCTVETFIRKEATLEVTAIESSELDVSTEPSTLEGQIQTSDRHHTLSSESEQFDDYVSSAEDLNFTQEEMFGFTYVVAKFRHELVDVEAHFLWWMVAYAKAGIDVDVRFGLRLPVRMLMEYPRSMVAGNNYTLFATLDPIDQPDFNETLFIFKAQLWVEVWAVGFGPYYYEFGPNIDKSASYETPLGPCSWAPLPSGEIKIFDSQWDPFFIDLVDVYLNITPSFGSDKITAQASASRNSTVVQNSNLLWSLPDQRLNFTVKASDDPTANYTVVKLSDFKYYFTKLKVDLDLRFVFVNWISWLTGEPRIHIATVDASWFWGLVGNPYVKTHSGYPTSVNVMVLIEGVIPPEPEDIALVYGFVDPQHVYAGESVNVTVGAKNLGNTTESFNVTLYSDNTVIGEQIIQDLTSQETKMLSFDWNTAGWEPGNTYTVSANATVLSNETDTDNNHLVVGNVAILYESPTVDFAYSPDPMIENQTIIFDASNSTAGSGTISAYTWDFGDGDSAETSNPITSHVYESKGTYTITLTVQNTYGLNDTIWKVRDVLRHDIAVTEVVPYRSWVYEGRLVRVNVTLLNCGDFNETVTLDLYYNLTANQQIGTIIADLSSNETKTLTFEWNTLGVQHCHNYTITALANIQFDSNTTNNVNEGTIRIKVRIMGDLNGDGKVDMKDVTQLILKFGLTQLMTGWNSDCDLNNDGRIDMRDIIIVILNFGTC